LGNPSLGLGIEMNQTPDMEFVLNGTQILASKTNIMWSELLQGKLHKKTEYWDILTHFVPKNFKTFVATFLVPIFTWWDS
jgi:hypothetical protein